MSTDWGVGCRDCQATHSRGDYYREDKRLWFSGEFNNCRDVEWLQRVCDARDAVVALCDQLGNAAISWCASFDVGSYACSASDFADFFRAHAGHAVAPMDEYGRFHDQCDKYLDGTRHCMLRRGHGEACSDDPLGEDESRRRCDECGATTRVDGFVARCTAADCGHAQTLRRDPPRPEPASGQRWLHRCGEAYDVVEPSHLNARRDWAPELMQWSVRPATGGDAFVVGRGFFACSSLAREA